MWGKTCEMKRNRSKELNYFLMRRLIVSQPSRGKRRILACESVLISTQQVFYTSDTAAATATKEDNLGSSSGSRLCRPPSVPTLLLEIPRSCAKRRQNTQPSKLTNAFILEFLRSRLSPLQTVADGPDESKSSTTKSKFMAEVEAKRKKGRKTAGSGNGGGNSASSIYGSGEVLSLDCRADLAAWSLVHEKEGDAQQSLIPRVEYNKTSHAYLVKSGGIHMGSAGLEGVHAALQKKINSMISHGNTERTQRKPTTENTKSAGVGSHSSSVPFVIGTDEAGRGPLAGPVVCAAYSRLLVKESLTYIEDEIVAGKSSLPPTGVILKPATVRDYIEEGARNSGGGCVHLPSSPPTPQLRGGHFPPEVVPAMDSKQFPSGERRYAFKALVTGESVSSECGSSSVSDLRQIIRSSSSSSSFSSGASFLRSLESLRGGEILRKCKNAAAPDENNMLPADSVTFHTITNPLPIEVALSISGGSDSNSQRLVPLVGEDYEKLMQRVSCIDDSDNREVKNNSSATATHRQTQRRKFICLEKLLRAAGDKDHPPLIATIAFKSIVKVPRLSSTLSSSSLTAGSEGKDEVENNASSKAAEVPLTIGNVRAALKSFDEVVKIGSKALASAEKKAAKAAAKAQREAEKNAAKLSKIKAKPTKPEGTAAKATHSEAVSVGDEQKELPSLSYPLDWQPDGLHASLKAIWDSHEQLYIHKKTVGGETNTSESETEGRNIPNHHHHYYMQHGAVSIVNHVFIDASNILAASMHGMTAAVRAVNANVIETQASLESAETSNKSFSSSSSPSSHASVGTCNLPAVVLVDGSQAPGDLVRLTADAKENPKVFVEGDAKGLVEEGDAHHHQWIEAAIPITKGDSTSYSIAAASLLAKSTRDAIMSFYGSPQMYPEYGLADHEGYPCASHRNAIFQHGLSPIHRKTYGPCRAVLLSKRSNA